MKNKKRLIALSIMILSFDCVYCVDLSWDDYLFEAEHVERSNYILKEKYLKKITFFNDKSFGIKKNELPYFFNSKRKSYRLPASSFFSRPPYRAPFGSIWVRKSGWKIVSNEDFVKEKQSQVRDSYAEVLGAKLPIKKSIYVYNLNNGKEKMLRSNKKYSIQVSGYGPRGSIRIKVFNEYGQEVKGDFITIPRNVTAGTDSAIANQALDALQEIQDAGDITVSCRTDINYGVVAQDPIEEAVVEEDKPSPVAVDPSRAQRGDDYREGCEALADGVTSEDSRKLKTCASGLLNWVNSGTKNMCEKLKKIFSLNEKEQDFIGMIMAAKAEAPSGLAAGSPDHLMIMKSLDNRRSASLRRGWGKPVSIADIAFQFDQYSAFNDHNDDNQFDAPAFLRNSGYSKLVDSFISYHHANWKPPGVIDNITHYYSPPAMIPKNSAPGWVRGGIRRNGAREVTNEIRVNGKPVVTSRNSSRGYHKFYVGIDGRNNYNASRDTRKQIVNQCN